jgi:hypothetical protein
MAIRNTDDLRTVLLETLELVKAGKVDPRKAGAISGLSSQVISTVRLDLDFMKLGKNNKPKLKAGGKSAPLIGG